MTTEIWTSSGQWDRPDGVRTIYVEVWGPGGSGANASGDYGGGGGGGGGFSAGTYAIDIETAGVSVPGTGNGGTTYLGDLIEAGGGSSAVGYGGGQGGYGGTGTVSYPGGAGANGGYFGDGGGGGGGAGTMNAGQDAAGSSGGTGGTEEGGNGGNGGQNGGNGDAGALIGGGGGGGGYPNGQGAAGERGELRITYTRGYLEWTVEPQSGVYYDHQVINQVEVTVRQYDGTTDDLARNNITISVETGPGSVSGTTTKQPSSGIATYNDLVLDQPGWYILRAESAFATGKPDPDFTSSFEILGGQQIVETSGQSLASSRAWPTGACRTDIFSLSLASNTSAADLARIASAAGLASVQVTGYPDGAPSPVMTGQAQVSTLAAANPEILTLTYVDGSGQDWRSAITRATLDIFEMHEIAGAEAGSAASQGGMLSRFDLEGAAAVRTHYTGSQALGLAPATARSWSITTLAAAPQVSADMGGCENSAVGLAGELGATVHGTGQTMPATWTASRPEALAHLSGNEPSTTWDSGATDILSLAASAASMIVGADGQLAADSELHAVEHAATAVHAPTLIVDQAYGAVLVCAATGSDGDCHTVLTGSAVVADPAGVMATGLVALDGRAQVVASSGWRGVSRPIVHQDVRYTLTVAPAAQCRLTVAPAARYRLGLGRTG